jgi:N6-adenosine-specific RNA methylase IME4
LKIGEIKVPKKRLRPLGDIAALVESIGQVGLINPITVTDEFRLISGLHRLEACRQLGHATILACVVPLDEVHAEIAEIDENLIRNDLSALERIEHNARRVELLDSLGQKAKGGRPKNNPLPNSGFPKTTEEIGEAAGMCASAIRRDVQIGRDLADDVKTKLRGTETANSTTQLLKLSQMPEADQRVIAKKLESEEASSVTEAIRQVKREQLAARGDVLPVGDRQYRVIYSDPPWQYSDSRAGLADYSQTAAADHYPTMSVEELCELDVKAMAEDDAVLFCWATFPLLPDALQVVKAWGFTYKTAFVWSKGRPNFGHYHNASAEMLMVCTRGSCTPEIDKRENQVQAIERTGKHSGKPEEFRELVSRLYPSGPRIELFRRGAAPKGWDVFGNEVARAG